MSILSFFFVYVPILLYELSFFVRETMPLMRCPVSNPSDVEWNFTKIGYNGLAQVLSPKVIASVYIYV